MSEPVSALSGASFDGIAHVEECGLQGMITLRGDLASRPVRAAAKAGGGVTMPKVRMAAIKDGAGLCWMSPDEVLVLCPYAETADRVTAMQAKLGATHALVADVSDARAMFRVSGPNAREVLAKLCPVDMSPAAFKPGMFRRTRMAQVPAALWMDSDGSLCIVCFRSVADYVFGLLATAAQPGSEIGYF